MQQTEIINPAHSTNKNETLHFECQTAIKLFVSLQLAFRGDAQTTLFPGNIVRGNTVT